MVQESRRWRGWLDNATVSAPTSTDTRRRVLRRPTSTGATTVTGPVGRNPGRRVFIGGVAAIAVVTAVGVAVGLSHRSGGTDNAQPYTIVTTAPASHTSTPPAFCTPGRIGAALISNTGADRATGDGAIAEYEYRYFTRRDPAAVMELTDNGPGVPGPAQVADIIARIPAAVPWCVSVTPTSQPNQYETSVRYQPTPTSVPVSWLMNITVVQGPGGYRLVRIANKPA